MKLEFNRTIGEIFYKHPVTDEEVSVLMVEDSINYDAIESMLERYNAGYSLSRIKSNMDQDERLTGDETDYIIEQLEMFEEDMEKKSLEEVAPWTENAERGIVDTDSILTVNKEGEQEIVKLQPEKKERKKREPKSPTALQGTGKKTLSPQEYIEQLQEKMDLTKLVSHVSIPPEIPEGLSKAGRELMIELGKEHRAMISSYLQKIQEL